MDELETHAARVAIRAKFLAVRPFLNEQLRRVWAANEAQAVGRGGIGLVALATGVARSTSGRGLQELRAVAVMGKAVTTAANGTVVPAESAMPARVAPDRVLPLAPAGRQRRPGGGRTALTQRDPTLLAALDGLPPLWRTGCDYATWETSAAVRALATRWTSSKAVGLR